MGSHYASNIDPYVPITKQ